MLLDYSCNDWLLNLIEANYGGENRGAFSTHPTRTITNPLSPIQHLHLRPDLVPRETPLSDLNSILPFGGSTQMYSIDNIDKLLDSLGLISKGSILYGDFEATTLTRRNRNIQVTTNRAENYLVKQPSDPDSESAETLRAEIRFYEFLDSEKPAFHVDCATVRHSDLENALLVLDFYREAIPLWRYYKQRGADRLPLRTISEVGRLLAELHREFEQPVATRNGKIAFLSTDLPFGFKLNKPSPRVLGYIRPGGLAYLRELQAMGDVMLRWEVAAQTWEINSVIHGDVKLDNFLVQPDPNQEDIGSDKIHIVDWELVQQGDKAWDIAGVFQDFIFWWTISMPDMATPEEMVRNAGFPITRLKPCLQTFWERYIAHGGQNTDDEAKLLTKVVTFSAIRIFQTSYEIASKFDEIPPIARILLGVAKSILEKPTEAASGLFGIEPGRNQ